VVGGCQQVPSSTQVVLVEGNYLLLPEEPWRQLRALFDEAWFVDCPLDVAMLRVLRRQVRAAVPTFQLLACLVASIQ
jgi:pantothenate kinase